MQLELDDKSVTTRFSFKVNYAFVYTECILLSYMLGIIDV